MQPRAFIVHGHHTQARTALERFLSAIGVVILPFHRAAANDMTGTNLASVLAGIKKADVVLVLFTPEEQAALHDPGTGGYLQQDESGEAMAGWQPRPNVILEAGVAAAVARKKTALIKVGVTRRISDLDGIRHIELHKPHSHEEIWDFIAARAGRAERPREMSEDAVMAFHRAVAAAPLRRWNYHDELGQLEAELRIRVDRSRKTFVDVLTEYAQAYPESEWNNRDIVDYFLQRYEYSQRHQRATDGFFWNLVIHGVFALKDIETWAQPRKQLWCHALEDDVVLAPRGKALLEKLRATKSKTR